MKSNRQLPDSKHFRLERLADGVFASIHIGGGAAISNAGIIDLGDRTLILDAFFTPQAAADLRATAEEITGCPVDMVVDSHYHNDHIWGNQAFSSDTDIIATAETRQLITTRGLDELGAFKKNAAAINSELAWLAALRQDAGAPVPEPVPTLQGELMIEVTFPGVAGPGNCSLLRWVI